MNAVRLLALCAVIVLAAACASAPAPQAQETGKRYQADAEYMAMVEMIARRRGITVTWINPPEEADEAEASAEPIQNH